jgi:VanZ family protein
MNRSSAQTVLRWLPAIAWMAIIFWFSSQPDLPRPPSDLLNFLMRKGAHFGVYAVLALCYLYALGDWRRRPLALLLAVLYAISDEYHQSWTPKRVPAPTDVLIDTAGAITALWVVAPWLRSRIDRASVAGRRRNISTLLQKRSKP